MTSLKACSCGEEAEYEMSQSVVKRGPRGIKLGRGYRVICPNCGQATWFYSTMLFAAEAWNARSQQPKDKQGEKWHE